MACYLPPTAGVNSLSLTFLFINIILKKYFVYLIFVGSHQQQKIFNVEFISKLRYADNVHRERYVLLAILGFSCVLNLVLLGDATLVAKITISVCNSLVVSY